MVIRKPVPAQSNSHLPYPASLAAAPPPPHAPPAPPSGSTVINTSGPSHLDGQPGSDDEDEDEWDKSDSEYGGDKPTPEDIPAPLRISRPTSRQSNQESELPAVLRVGPPGGVPQKSKESLVSNESNNPWKSDTSRSPPRSHSQTQFLKPQTTGEALFGGESSAAVWRGAAQENGAPLAELPTHQTPTDAVSKLSLGGLPTDPYQHDLVSSPISTQPPLIPVEPETEKEVYNGRQNSESSSAWDPQMDLSSLDAFSSRGRGLSDNAIAAPQRTWQEQKAWEQSERERRQNEAAAALERAQRAEQERRAEEEWHAGEAAAAAGFPPHLPPQTSPEEQAPSKPPRPQIDTAAAQDADRPAVDTPTTVMKKQRNQTYQIKKVRWFDASVQKTRRSPILVQNANGPCPLLALVNALTLSTPMNVETALVETLRTREQVSLGLLLDAVFEELMSGRRGDAAQELPDVGDLYSFLITLHTGMNVNPRFVQVPDRSSMDMHPALRPQTQPGGFEETREMKLYSTFNVPLMHGWLPKRDSADYAAFERSAKTYEDAQNIQFYEEELDAKLSSTGLNTEEQHIFEDLASIKHFLTTWPTQLTEHGLHVLLEHVQPGQFAILFRNDHFSTIYKEPRSNQILTLVTDAGYSSHEEIVWESLVDINGKGTEHFSGDFRPVSHNAPPQAGPAGPRGSSLSQRPVQSMLDVDQGWTAVQSKNKRGKETATRSRTNQEDGVVVASSSAATAEGPVSSVQRTKAEQEDLDLALALTLQDEEEERARMEQDARRREEQLSRQVLDTQAPQRPAGQPQGNRPLIPPRRTNNNRNSNAEEPPPPTYEQASKDRRFNPPRDHPASPHAPVHQRQQSAYMQNASSLPPGQHPLPGASSSSLNRRHSRPLVDQIPPGSGMGRGRRNSGMSPVAGPGGNPDKCTIM